MTKGKEFQQKEKCKRRHCSPVINSSWCDLKSIRTTPEVHDILLTSKSDCHKQITFTTRQVGLEGNGIETTLKNYFTGTERTCEEFLKRAVNISPPFIGMAVSAKTKNTEVGHASTNNLKST